VAGPRPAPPPLLTPTTTTTVPATTTSTTVPEEEECPDLGQLGRDLDPQPDHGRDQPPAHDGPPERCD
jgi:hypothetical protein